MYFNGLFNLDDWDDDAKFAIFDDFPDWSKFYSYKQWIGAQSEFTITDKYRKKCTVRWGRPVIIVSNELPDFPDMIWTRENAIIVHITNKLY